MSCSIAGHVYIVTGASRGFGLAIARELVARGAKTGLIARDAGALAAVVDELGSQHCHTATCDITDSASVQRAIDELAGHFGRLDGIVNNAGVARPGFIEQYSDEDIQAQLQINVAGLMYCCRAAIPHLAGSPNPRIVNISSASAYHHDEMLGLSLYAASKAAVERLTRDLRREMQEKDIGVTIVRPGAAATDFAAGWDFDKLKAGLELWHKRCGPYMDTGMDVSHVAESVAFCLGMDPGVSVDELEIRPNRLMDKLRL